MKLGHWLRFTWELGALPEKSFVLDPHYKVRLAAPNESKMLREAIICACAQDIDRSELALFFETRFEAEFNRAIENAEETCLVATHGARIIGASALDFRKEAETHLLSGPCILTEYRNRNLGTQLLHKSLQMLRASGLQQAHGIIKANTPGARFLYPKLNSVSAGYRIEPQLAA